MKRFNFTRRLTEMATLGTVGQMTVIVWTDHNPPHFHIEKTGEYDVRISIESLKIIDYKWQKNNKSMSSTEIRNLNKWLKEPSKKYPSITNLQRIEIAWDALNPVKE